VQVTTREQKAKPSLEAIATRMQVVLERVCAEVAATAALYQESIRDPSELADTTGWWRGSHQACYPAMSWQPQLGWDGDLACSVMIKVYALAAIMHAV
jgi:hypothetical protein